MLLVGTGAYEFTFLMVRRFSRIELQVCANKDSSLHSLSRILCQAVPSSLGVSAIRSYDVNSLAVPRKAKEAIGGITRLTHKDGEKTTPATVSL